MITGIHGTDTATIRHSTIIMVMVTDMVMDTRDTASIWAMVDMPATGSMVMVGTTTGQITTTPAIVATMVDRMGLVEVLQAGAHWQQTRVALASHPLQHVRQMGAARSREAARVL